MRRLSAEEAALWRRVTGGVRRFDSLPSGEMARSVGEGPTPKARSSALPQSRHSLPGPAPSALRAATSPGGRGSNTLDSTWDKRLSTGRIEPDMTIDLHGETLASAHAHLNRALDAAVRNGARTILLITGRPAADNPRLPPTRRGVIRASVADWIAASPNAGRIAAIRKAHQRHGGAGALYVILKRKGSSP